MLAQGQTLGHAASAPRHRAPHQGVRPLRARSPSATPKHAQYAPANKVGSFSNLPTGTLRGACKREELWKEGMRAGACKLHSSIHPPQGRRTHMPWPLNPCARTPQVRCAISSPQEALQIHRPLAARTYSKLTRYTYRHRRHTDTLRSIDLSCLPPLPLSQLGQVRGPSAGETLFHISSNTGRASPTFGPKK